MLRLSHSVAQFRGMAKGFPETSEAVLRNYFTKTYVRKQFTRHLCVISIAFMHGIPIRYAVCTWVAVVAVPTAHNDYLSAC